MNIKGVVDYLCIPQIDRGLITRPKNKALKDIKLSDLEWDTWSKYSQKSKTERQKREALSFRDVANLFIREGVDLDDGGLNQKVYDKGMLSRAIITALAYAKVSEKENPDAIVTKTLMARFRYNLSHDILHNDFIPVYAKDKETRFRQDYEHARVKNVFLKSHKANTDFYKLAYPTRSDGIQEDSQAPMFVRFLKAVVGEQFISPFSCPRDTFPGPGVKIFSGHRAKMFPRGALQKQLLENFPQANDPAIAANRHYRELMVKLEHEVRDTSYGVFRHMVLVSNPKIMQVSGIPFDLLMYNDHTVNLKMAYLIPHLPTIVSRPSHKYGKDFLQDPELAVFKGTPCDPNKIDTIFQKEILTLCWASNIAGMQRAIPVEPPKGLFYPNCWFKNYLGKWYQADLYAHESNVTLKNETRDRIVQGCVWGQGHMHITHMDEEYKKHNGSGYWSSGFPLENLEPPLKAHDEITTCAETGFALFDLLNRAFMLYSYGYDYIPNETNIRLSNPMRLLEQSMRWSLSPKEYNKPFLVPMTENGFNKELVEEIGAVDTKLMACYRRNGKSFMLPNKLWKDMDDQELAEARNAWVKKFIEPAFECRLPKDKGKLHGHEYKRHVNLVFLPGDQVGPQIKEILGVG